MIDSRLTKLPIRLVQENGNTIPLDVTSYNVVVDREHSQIPIPLKGAQNVGIDLNMPSIQIGLSGVLVDDASSKDKGKGATAEIDLGYVKEVIGGEFSTGPMTIKLPSYIRSFLPFTWGCGAPDVWEADYMDPSELGRHILPQITKSTELLGKSFSLPLTHWKPQSSEGTIGASATLPVTGAGLWLDATSFTASNDGDAISSWTNKATSSDLFTPTGYSDLFVTPAFANSDSASTKPTVRKNFANGLPVVEFDGGDYLDMSLTGMTQGTQLCAHQLQEQTVFVVLGIDHTMSSYDNIIDNYSSTGTPFQSAGWQIFRSKDSTQRIGWKLFFEKGDVRALGDAPPPTGRDGGNYTYSAQWPMGPIPNQLTCLGMALEQQAGDVNYNLHVIRENALSKYITASTSSDALLTDIPVATTIQVVDYDKLANGDTITIDIRSRGGSESLVNFTAGGGGWTIGANNGATATNIANAIDGNSNFNAAVVDSTYVHVEPASTDTAKNTSGKYIHKLHFSTQDDAGSMSIVRHKQTRLGGIAVPGGTAPSASSAYAPEFKGQLAELIIYPRVLSDSEIYNVEAYLLNKWGIKPSTATKNPYMHDDYGGVSSGNYHVDFIFDPYRKSTHYEPDGYVLKSVCTPLEISGMDISASSDPINIYNITGYGHGNETEGAHKVFSQTEPSRPYILAASLSQTDLHSYSTISHNGYDLRVPSGLKMLGKLETWTHDTIQVNIGDYNGLYNTGFEEFINGNESIYKYIWILRESESSFRAKFAPQYIQLDDNQYVPDGFPFDASVWTDGLNTGLAGARHLSSFTTPTIAIPVYDLMNPTPKFEGSTGVRTAMGTNNPIEYLAQKIAKAITLSGSTDTSSFTDATCDYNNDPTITHDDDDGKIKVGMLVTGTGIPDGAYVKSVTSDTAFELSVATTGGSVTNGTLTFSNEIYYNTAHIGTKPVSDKLVDIGREVSSFDSANRSIAATDLGHNFASILQKDSLVYTGATAADAQYAGKVSTVSTTHIILQETFVVPVSGDNLYTPQVTLDKAFAVDVVSGGQGGNRGRVIITQKTAGPLTPGLNGENLRHIKNTGFDAHPKAPKVIFKHFSGGRAASKVKSAGDHAQDLMGLAANMQNFGQERPDTGQLGGAALTLAEAYTTTLEATGIIQSPGYGDYIRGIQIPYITTTNVSALPLADSHISRAVANGSNTHFITQQDHGLAVGDQIEIIGFRLNNPNATLSNAVNGEYTVSSVPSERELVVSLNLSSSTHLDSSVGIIIKIDDENYKREQRNFYITHGAKSAHQIGSNANYVHASVPFDFDENGPEKSGMSIALDKLDIRFNAEERLYEFDMVVTAIDYLM